MPNYIVSADIVTATISAKVTADNESEAIKIFDELGPDEIMEEPDRRIENYEVEETK